MVEKWGAIVSDGEEADDLIGIAATKYGPDTVVASIDKDMLQIPCRHFNFTRNEWTEVSELEGTKFFYKQILTGDSADNIVGLHGIGPKKASTLIDGLNTEEEMWDCVVKMYNGDVERVVENARLLWLRRKEGELWEPPVQ
jgi:DNA polymerase-1